MARRLHRAARAKVRFKLYYWIDEVRYKDDNDGLYYLAPPPPSSTSRPRRRSWPPRRETGAEAASPAPRAGSLSNGIETGFIRTFIAGKSLPDGAALVEIDGTIKFASTRMQRLFNLAKGDLVGSNLAKHARTAGPIMGKIATALRQLKRAELAGTLNSQRSVFASISILRTNDVTLVSSTPVPSAFTRTFTLSSTTRFTQTRIIVARYPS